MSSETATDLDHLRAARQHMTLAQDHLAAISYGRKEDARLGIAAEFLRKATNELHRPLREATKEFVPAPVSEEGNDGRE